MLDTWEQRLAAMDHSKGTSDVMRKAAMLAEIKALRSAHRRALNRCAMLVDQLIAARDEAAGLRAQLDRAAMHRITGVRRALS